MRGVEPTGEELFFDKDEVIVSKTDRQGRITYANDVFARLAEMDPKDYIGEPHNVIRHPGMPRCIFKLMWEKIESGKEIFAYIKNMSAKGKHYWVIAHVTPSYDFDGNCIGYHSNRRCPDRQVIGKIDDLYRSLRVLEDKDGRKQGLENSWAALSEAIHAKQDGYDRFIWAMGEGNA